MASLFSRWKQWRSDEHRASLLAYALLFFWCLPLFFSPNTIGVLDWDWFTAYFTVLRSTLLEHGQFPGYNPFMYLGSPLWANPQIGPLSLFTPFVLLFGPLTGIKLGIACAYWLSYESGRALGRRLFEAPQSAVLFGLLYALNTALAAHWVMGHLCFVAYPLAPWLILWCLRLGEDRWAGLKAGLMAGLMVQMGLHYYVVYVFFLAGLLTLWLSFRDRLWTFLPRFVGLGLTAFLAMTAIRLFPMLQVLGDFPRQLKAPFSLGFSALKAAFFTPAVSPNTIWLKLNTPRLLMTISANEFYAYVGFGVLALALLSLRRGLRWWHVGAVLSLALLLGSTAFWHPSRWLGMFPPFKSMWNLLRWRMVVLVCVGLAAAHGVDIWLPWLREKAGDWGGRIAWAVVFLVALELVVVLSPSWKKGLSHTRFPNLTRQQLRLPDKDKAPFLSMHSWKPSKRAVAQYTPLFRLGVGSVRGYEPLFGYLPARSIRRFPGHRGYRGEYTIRGKAVRPVLWSPNRLVFKGLPVGQALHINLNPGRGWSSNGEPLFVGWKVFELKRPFVVLVPPSGKVELRYTPPGLWTGVVVSLLCALLLFGFWFWERKQSLSAPDSQPAVTKVAIEEVVEEEKEEYAEDSVQGETA